MIQAGDHPRRMKRLPKRTGNRADQPNTICRPRHRSQRCHRLQKPARPILQTDRINRLPIGQKDRIQKLTSDFPFSIKITMKGIVINNSPTPSFFLPFTILLQII